MLGGVLSSGKKAKSKSTEPGGRERSTSQKRASFSSRSKADPSVALNASEKVKTSKRLSFRSIQGAGANGELQQQNNSNNGWFRANAKKEVPSEPSLTPATGVESPWKSPADESRRTYDDILAEINHLVDEGATDSPSSMKNIVVNAIPNVEEDMSHMTDDFYSHYRQQLPPVPREVLGNRVMVGDTLERGQEMSVLFTFQRRGKSRSTEDGSLSAEGTLYETTLNARTVGDQEESMEDIVKRLQQKGSASGVLRFDKTEIRQIKAGEKEVVFLMSQINNARFSKEEFGRMMASEVAALTLERPILIEIQAEEVIEGETLSVY